MIRIILSIIEATAGGEVVPKDRRLAPGNGMTLAHLRQALVEESMRLATVRQRLLASTNLKATVHIPI